MPTLPGSVVGPVTPRPTQGWISQPDGNPFELDTRVSFDLTDSGASEAVARQRDRTVVLPRAWDHLSPRRSPRSLRPELPADRRRMDASGDPDRYAHAAPWTRLVHLVSCYPNVLGVRSVWANTIASS